jgi:sugar-specific transcriptional regulator TrmB/DNA-binding CsgD family transcriptional regulator
MTERSDARDLEPVGVTPQEEGVYRELLSQPGGTVSEVALSIGTSRAETRATLGSLETKGLVTRSPGKPVRFVPVSPEAALEALVASRQSQLDHVRVLAQQWEQGFRHRPSRTSAADLLEVLDSPEVVGSRALQLVRMARREYLTFDKPPYTTSVEDNDPEMENALKRGVRLRVVYDRESLLMPGGLEAVHEWMSRGEESRVSTQVPFKLNIVDRKVALLPLVVEEPGLVGGALLIQSSHLVDALILLWEMFWDRALPIARGGDVSLPSGDRPGILSDEDATLVDLMLAGATSETMAHRLEIGTATVERRIRRLMHELGAQTRFQAGFRVGLTRSQDRGSG